MNKGLSLLFFLAAVPSKIFTMEPIQEKIRNEKMLCENLTRSIYDIPWSFGSQDRINNVYIEELNKNLSKYNLVAEASTDTVDHKLTITIKAHFIEGYGEPLPVHTIEMKLDDQKRADRYMDFVMYRRIEEITEYARTLRSFLDKISKREINQNRTLIFKLKVLPAVSHNVANSVGTEIGVLIKDLLLNFYQLFRLRKIVFQDNSKLTATIKKNESLQAHIDDFQTNLEEINDALEKAVDEQEITELKKQKAVLLKKYIHNSLKQTEE